MYGDQFGEFVSGYWTYRVKGFLFYVELVHQFTASQQ